MNSKGMKFAVGSLIAGLLAGAPAQAQQVYKIGMSVGLTGYAATVDRAWRDGVEIAVAALNAKGGIMGRKSRSSSRTTSPSRRKRSPSTAR